MTLPCRSTVALGEVDSNRVIVTGQGTIHSLGHSPTIEGLGVPCTKTVYFEPTGEINIEASSHLALLGSTGRRVGAKSFATFSCDGYHHWTENNFTSLDWSPGDLDELIDIMSKMALPVVLMERLAVLREKRQGGE